MSLPETLIDAARAVREGAITATALTQAALERAQMHQALNALAWVDPQAALAEAAQRDAEARSGRWRGPLHGVPITVKDLFNVRGMPTRGGTRAPLPRLTPEEAPAVARLRAAGAVILAKTNLQEIALGLTGENPWTGDVKNPHHPAHQAGGSSSGAAAAVAVGIGYGALGSDTAGSIRLPAAFCGVVGFKPSFGAVPLEGALPLVPSCDHAGPLARTVADAALLFSVLAEQPTYAAPLDAPPVLAVPFDYLEGWLTRELRAAFAAWLIRLQRKGAKIVSAHPPLALAEQHFPALRAESALVHHEGLTRAPSFFSPFVRAALQQGYAVPAVDYLRAREAQHILRHAIADTLRRAGAQALLMPTAPGAAPLRSTSVIALERGATPLRQAILHFTLPAAFAGVPAASLPFAWADGLPLGAQIIAPFGADETTLRIAAWLERVR